MTPIRRVITGVDAEGRSCVVDDGPVPVFYELPERGGLSLAGLFEVAMPPVGADDGGDPESPLTMVPPVGFARVIRTFIPPDSTIAIGSAEKSDDALTATTADTTRGQYFDPARGPNMHVTPSIDVIVVAAGRIDLVLETGPVTLESGEVVVQRSTWHSWANPYDEPCVLLGVNFAVGQ